MKNREGQAVSIWRRGVDDFSFFLSLVEFKKCFLINILNISFHKGIISLWNSIVSEWSKSGQTGQTGSETLSRGKSQA